MSKRTVGAALICGALLLAAIALGLWAKESHDVEQARETWALENGMRSRVDLPPLGYPEQDRSGPIALGAVSAVLFLSGVILVTVSPQSATPDASARVSPRSESP